MMATKKPWARRLIGGLVFALMSIQCLSQGTEIRPRLTDYFAALNRYNVEAYLGFYAPGAVTVRLNGDRVPIDPAVERGYREFEAGTHAHFTFDIHEVKGDTADVFESESNDFYKVLGAEAHKSHWQYRFRQGHIYEEVQLSPPNEEYLRAYRDLRAWIPRARPEKAKAVTMEDGNLIFNGRTAADIMRLAEEWRAAKNTKN